MEWGEKGGGSYCLMGKEFLLGVMENLEIVMKAVQNQECN